MRSIVAVVRYAPATIVAANWQRSIPDAAVGVAVRRTAPTANA